MNINLTSIGHIKTPYQTLEECPRNVMTDGPLCRIIVHDEYAEGLYGLEPGAIILVLYWMDKAASGRLIQTSRRTGEARGVFALRSPQRPNPIGAAAVTIDALEKNEVHVRGLDCLDGTPLLDVKPAMANEVQ